MNRDKLIAAANHKIELLRNSAIDFNDFDEEIAFKPEDLREFFNFDRESNGSDFQEYLEVMVDGHSLDWPQSRIEELAKDTSNATLEELHDYANATSREPDYLIFVPIETDTESGCAVINIEGYPEFLFSLVDVFPNEDDARRFVQDNWCL